LARRMALAFAEAAHINGPVGPRRSNEAGTLAAKRRGDHTAAGVFMHFGDAPCSEVVQHHAGRTLARNKSLRGREVGEAWRGLGWRRAA